jgi:hypothetical protein
VWSSIRDFAEQGNFMLETEFINTKKDYHISKINHNYEKNNKWLRNERKDNSNLAGMDVFAQDIIQVREANERKKK